MGSTVLDEMYQYSYFTISYINACVYTDILLPSTKKLLVILLTMQDIQLRRHYPQWETMFLYPFQKGSSEDSLPLSGQATHSSLKEFSNIATERPCFAVLFLVPCHSSTCLLPTHKLQKPLFGGWLGPCSPNSNSIVVSSKAPCQFRSPQ